MLFVSMMCDVLLKACIVGQRSMTKVFVKYRKPMTLNICNQSLLKLFSIEYGSYFIKLKLSGFLIPYLMT